MPTTSLPQDPDLDQLRKQARDLQRAVRGGDPASLALVGEFHPEPADAFRLADAQLVIARRYGFGSWARLRRHVEVIAARSWRPEEPAPVEESIGDRFLRSACLTYSGSHPADVDAAAKLLAVNPDLSSAGVAAAAACVDVTALQGFLSADPMSAVAPTGPYGWSPLLYLAYARHLPPVDEQSTLDAARMLLDAGADPNDGRFWHGLPTPFTVLTGVFGNGENDEPAHPHALALARLLLDRGADPNDGQTLYNRMFSDDDAHLVLLFDYGLGRPSNGPWYRLLGDGLESPPVMLRNLLAWAVVHDQRGRVELLARNGVDVRAPFTELRGSWGQGRTPAALALVNGDRRMSELLVSLGAQEPRLDAEDSYIAAVVSGDTPEVVNTPDGVIEGARRRRPALVVWAAARGAANAVDVLVRHGFDVNAMGRSDLPIEAPWQTALHVAAERNDAALVARLLDLGADPALRDLRFHATPQDWARHFGYDELVPLLESDGTSG